MNENINLVEILKDAPKGTPLYSTILGECTFDHISGGFIWVLSPKCDVAQAFTKEGYISFKNTWCSEVCCLFPSKHHATWNDFKAPWKHKHFEPGQKVLVPYHDGTTCKLRLTFYSHYDESPKQHFTTDAMCFSDKEVIAYKGNENKLGKPVE